MSSRQFSLDFPFAYGQPQASALFRSELEDFKVDEVLGFPLSAEGEHLCLHIEKRGENTRWVAKLLAEHFGVDELSVGYCGLKDRRAVARQWFSVHLPYNTSDGDFGNSLGQKAVADNLFGSVACRVLEFSRHHKKLRRGIHQANQFEIRLRQVQCDIEALTARLQKVLEQGVPNYFGEQRFGINGGNLARADDLLRTQYGTDRKYDRSRSSKGKQRRRKPGSSRGGLYLSAARSYLFNLVLAARINQNNFFSSIVDEVEPISGPLWGRGRSQAIPAVCEFEATVLAEWRDWTNALEFSGLQQERRSVVLLPEALSWQWLPAADGNTRDLILSFSLPPGTYATSILRELAQLVSPVSASLDLSASSAVS